MTDRSDGSRNDSNRIDTRADTTRDAKSDEQDGTPIGADAPRAPQDAPRTRHQEWRGPVSTRRQRTGHAADETADAWMFRPGDDAPPRSGYGEQGFGVGEGGDGRWGGGRRGGYGGGRPGGDHGTRGGGWSTARQRHEMGRGPRSFGPDGWGPVDPAHERQDAALNPAHERQDAAPDLAPGRKGATPEPARRDQPDPGDT